MSSTNETTAREVIAKALSHETWGDVFTWVKTADDILAALEKAGFIVISAEELETWKHLARGF
jgi:hypothetical protein